MMGDAPVWPGHGGRAYGGDGEPPRQNRCARSISSARDIKSKSRRCVRTQLGSGCEELNGDMAVVMNCTGAQW